MIKKESKFFIILLAMFAALPPFAINTYAPAIPNIADAFGVSNELVLTTFTTYTLGFAFGMLFWGPVSDKYGRKKTIVVGMVIYVISTIICSLSTDIDMLSNMRTVQGFSDAVGGIIAFSIARDCFSSKKLLSMVATIVIIMLIAPIIGPVIGTVLIYLTGEWQSSFHFLTCYGLFLLVCSFFIPETLQEETKQSRLMKCFSDYWMHLTNLKFLFPTFISTFIFATMFLFTASGSILYLDVYNVGYVEYCVLYSCTATSSIIANVIIRKYSEYMNKIKFPIYGMILTIASILIMQTAYINGFDSPYIVTICMFVLAFGVSLTTTLFYSLSLNSISKSFGAANSIANFSRFFVIGVFTSLVTFSNASNLLLTILHYQLILCLLAVLVLVIFLFKSRDINLI